METIKMIFGDFIRAVKATIKHDDSIVDEYDWERLRSFKGVTRLNELIVLLERLKEDERFLSLGDFLVDDEDKAFKWDLKKTPFTKVQVKDWATRLCYLFMLQALLTRLLMAQVCHVYSP